ncbi:MAG: phospholipase D-like domain-containing protein [Myxococcota bacterium]
MRRLRLAAIALASLLTTSCGGASGGGPDADKGPAGGKADDADASARVWEPMLTAPFCDECTAGDKEDLQDNSAIVARILELIENAETRVDVAQFTFSNRDIEAALLAAHQDPNVTVRVAMNAEQQNFDSVAKRLADAGVNVRFITGKDLGNRFGLQHAKFMRVDGETLLMGSNNWSSTGTSINNENTVVLRSGESDPILTAFDCYFEHMFESKLDDAASCSTDEVTFTPSTLPFKMIREELRGAQTGVDVMMHHITFDNLLKELAKVAERGVPVRLLLNESERPALTGARWDRIRAAKVQIRFKKANEDLSQIMHHKLVIVDGKTLINGSGNWSGAFFNNYEFYLKLTVPEVVTPFIDNFRRLWGWSLTAESLDAGLTAAEQDVADTKVFFGNLHAHHHAPGEERKHDDGHLEREVDGEIVDVSEEVQNGETARHAFEYARDEGGLDFMALSPHVADHRDDDPADIANMTVEAFVAMTETARKVTAESDGTFLALTGSEWSTNSSGNHVGVLGVEEPPKVERGRFDQLWDGFLPERAKLGEHPIVALNHPRTFRRHTETLDGSWDQVFDVNLLDIPKNGERNKKFNDFGLDDYPPLADVRDRWIEGNAEPDRGVVAETQANIAAAAAPYARLMEVTVNRGTDIRGTDSVNPSLNDTEEGGVERFVKVHSDWDYYLRSGWQLAPIASHDNHAANWGAGHSSRTAVIASSLSEAGLIAALGDRAVYASEDEDLEIRLYADGRIRAEQTMATRGDAVELSLLLRDPDFDGPYEVTVFMGTVGGDSVKPIASQSVSGDEWHAIKAPLPSTGDHFVYLEIHEAGPDRMAWTAPVFVTRR